MFRTPTEALDGISTAPSIVAPQMVVMALGVKVTTVFAPVALTFWKFPGVGAPEVPLHDTPWALRLVGAKGRSSDSERYRKPLRSFGQISKAQWKDALVA